MDGVKGSDCFTWGVRQAERMIKSDSEITTMVNYRYIENEFALSDEGIHLLRSGYNFDTIRFSEVKRVKIANGVGVRNPLIVMILGFLFIGFSLFQTFWVYELFNDPTVHHIAIESIIVIVFPFFVGIYMLYVSVKKELLLIIETQRKIKKLPISSFKSNGKLPEVEKFLNERLCMNVGYSFLN